MRDGIKVRSMSDALLIRRSSFLDALSAVGRFVAVCRDRDGNVQWEDIADNVVCTVGKNLAFTSFLAGSAYTVVGPYMGLISGTSFTATAATDTMASHAGWLEAGNANAPQYSGTRDTCVWAASSAGAIALSAALSFTFTASGTVQGCFILYGPGAVNTIDNTSGTLWSAGAFTGGSKTVASGDQLNCSYSVSM